MPIFKIYYLYKFLKIHSTCSSHYIDQIQTKWVQLKWKNTAIILKIVLYLNFFYKQELIILRAIYRANLFWRDVFWLDFSLKHIQSTLLSFRLKCYVNYVPTCFLIFIFNCFLCLLAIVWVNDRVLDEQSSWSTNYCLDD